MPASCKEGLVSKRWTSLVRSSICALCAVASEVPKLPDLLWGHEALGRTSPCSTNWQRSTRRP